MALNAKKLYTALSQDKNYEGIGSSFEAFQQYFSNPSNAQQLYDALKQDKNYDGIGSSLESFTDYFGLKKKDGSQTQGSSASSTASSPSGGASTTNSNPTTGTSASIVSAPKSNPFFGDDFYDKLNRRTRQAGDNTLTAMPQQVQAGLQFDQQQNQKDAAAVREVAKTGNPALVGSDTRLIKKAAQARRTELALDADTEGKSEQEVNAIYKGIDEQVARERREFSQRFYDGQLTADDVATLKRGNPITRTDDALDDESVAQMINQKTKNLSDWAAAVRSKGVMDFGKEREQLDAANESEQTKIQGIAGQNYIYKQDGRWVTNDPQFQYQADEANASEQKIADNNAKLSFISKQFKDNEYARDKQIFDQKIAEKIASLHGGRSMAEIMRLLDAGKDAGGFLRLGEDGKLSAQSAAQLAKLTDQVVNENNLEAIKAMKYNSQTKFGDEVGLFESLGKSATGGFGQVEEATAKGNDKGDFFEEYQDVLGRLNFAVRGQIAQEDFRNQFINGEGKELAPLVAAQSKLSDYFSQDSVRAIESGIKGSQDAAILQIHNKYEQQLREHPEYTAIADKWTKNVQDGLVSPDIAQKNIEADLRNNQALKGIADQRDKEVDAAMNAANRQRMAYMINGVKELGDSNIVINEDGTIGIKGVSAERTKELAGKLDAGMRAAYERSVNAVQQREGAVADVANQANALVGGKFEAAAATGFADGANGMMKSLTRWLYHKTGHGVDDLRYFQGGQEESLNVGSYADRHFKYNGLSSLIDPAYYGYSSGQSAPYAIPTIAAGALTGGTTMGILMGSIGGATFETATNAINTYNDVYENGVDANGMRATEKDASRAAAKNFSEELLPNIAMQALEFGTLLRAERAVRPQLNAKTVLSGVKDVVQGAVIEGAQEGYQGYIQNNARLNGERREGVDIYDYMTTDDFRQNFFGGLAGGLTMSGVMKPMGYNNSIKAWKGVIENSTHEVLNNLPYTYALGSEQRGQGAEFRDHLRLRLANEDYTDAAEKATLERTLKYSESLRDNLSAQNLHAGNINALYAAHNLAMSDVYEGMAKESEGKAIAKVYNQQASSFTKTAASALEGGSKIFYLETKEGTPVFMSEQTADALLQNGNLQNMKREGHIVDVKSSDPRFNERVQQAFAQPAPVQATASQQAAETTSPAQEAVQPAEGLESPVMTSQEQVVVPAVDHSKSYRLAGEASKVTTEAQEDGRVRVTFEDGTTESLSPEDFHLLFEEAQDAAPQSGGVSVVMPSENRAANVVESAQPQQPAPVQEEQSQAAAPQSGGALVTMPSNNVGLVVTTSSRSQQRQEAPVQTKGASVVMPSENRSAYVVETPQVTEEEAPAVEEQSYPEAPATEAEQATPTPAHKVLGELKVVRDSKEEMIRGERGMTEWRRRDKVYDDKGRHVGYVDAVTPHGGTMSLTTKPSFEAFGLDGEQLSYMSYTQKEAIDALRRHYEDNDTAHAQLSDHEDRGTVTSDEYHNQDKKSEAVYEYQTGDRIRITDDRGNVTEGFWVGKEGRGVITKDGFSSIGSVLIPRGQKIENLTMQQSDEQMHKERRKEAQRQDKVLREARRINDAYWHENRTLRMAQAVVAASAFLNKNAHLVNDLDTDLYDSLNDIASYERKFTKTELKKESRSVIADKIREFAQKMEDMGKGQLYSLPIPITPKQLAKALRFTAELIEKGQQLVEAIKAGVKYIKDSFGEDVDETALLEEYKKMLDDKPVRKADETMAEYAMRVLEWRKTMLAGTAQQQAAALSNSQGEMDYIKNLNKGIELFRTNENMTVQEFNKQMGIPVDDYSTYVAVIKYFNSSNKNAKTLLENLRKTEPRKVLVAETDMLKMRFQQLSRGSKIGYDAAVKQLNKQHRENLLRLQEDWKEQMRKATAEQKQEYKDKLKELKDKHEAEMTALKSKYQDKLARIRGIRVEIEHMLNDYNEAGLFNGTTYTKDELLKFASMVNAAMTDKAFDNLQVFMDNMVTKVDYGRRLSEAKQLMKQGRALATAPESKRVIAAADIQVMKDMLALNPLNVKDIDRHIAMLKDMVLGRTAGSSYGQVGMTNQQYEMYIAEQQEHDLQRRAYELTQKLYKIQQSAGYALLEAAGKLSNMPQLHAFTQLIDGVVSAASAKSYENKIAELERYDDILNWLRSDMRDAFIQIEDGTVDLNTIRSFDYNDIGALVDQARLDDIANSNAAPKLKDELESQAKDVQDSMIVPNPNLSQEQNDALSVLKEIDVTGLTANELRLFMNLVDSITLNGNLDGYGKFKAIHQGQNVEVKGFLDWLSDTGYKVRYRIERGQLGDLIRQAKLGMSSSENVINRIANNATSLTNRLFMVSQIDRIKQGYVAAMSAFNEHIGSKLEAMEGFDRRSSESNVRLTMQAYLAQYEQGMTPEQQVEYFNKRLQRIKDDIKVKRADTATKNKKEAIVLSRIYDELRSKISASTGVDIGEIESREGVNLNSSVFAGLDFLTTQEKQMYDMFIDFHQSQRPAFMEVSERLLNKRLKMYDNYMPDNTRKLNGGAIDIEITSGGFGNSVFNNVTNQATGSFNQRIDGWNITGGADSRVLDYNWFGNQMADAKAMLVDIHTMEHRMVSQEVFKNKALMDELGADNVKLLKETILKELRGMTGIGKTSVNNGMKVISAASTGLASVAAKMNLLSFNAYLKQSVSALGNTATFLNEDAAMVYQAVRILAESNHPAKAEAEALMKTQEIWMRGSTGAGTTVYGSNNIREDVSIAEDGLMKHLRKASDWINGNNDLTGEEKGMMRKFLESGDVLGARGSWLALYGSSVVKQGVYPSFDAIDWGAEASNPNREAASFAQVTTSKMLNANSRHAHGEYFTDSNGAAAFFRSTVGLFGSFGWNKSIGLMNSLQSAFSRDIDAEGHIIPEEQRREEKDEAMRVIAAGLMEDVAFQAVRVMIGTGMIGCLFYGASAMLAGLAGNPEDEDKLWKKARESFGAASKQLAPAVISNYAFSIAGSYGQAVLNDYINDGINAMGGKDFFYEQSKDPNMNNNEGLINAALGNTKEDLYRMVRLAFKRTDRFGAPVNNPTGEEVAWATAALVSNFAQMTKRNDADINRLVHKRIRLMDKRIGERYKDEYWIDAAAAAVPDKVKVGVSEYNVSEEQGEYYYQQRQKYIKSLGGLYEQLGEKDKAKIGLKASAAAKGAMLAKYGADIVKPENVRKK